jgi:hypothetical protein
MVDGELPRFNGQKSRDSGGRSYQLIENSPQGEFVRGTNMGSRLKLVSFRVVPYLLA